MCVPPPSGLLIQSLCVCVPPSQWSADGVNDMFADAVLAVVLQLEASPINMTGVSLSS